MSAPAAAAPSGVVTFLFTDVEGSTRRWEADAEGMRAALAAHDEVLRKAIEAHGGWLFKHTGDGVCAAFSSPRAAVDAAIAAQRKLELPVRMGLATGEAEVRGTDYFGTVLNRAARVMPPGTAVRSFWPSRQRFCSVEWTWSIWGRAGCGMYRCRSASFNYEQRVYARSFRRCVRSIPVLETCGLPPAASSDVSPNSTRCKRRSRLIGL
ncbi:MAG TPA: adenylate/guanylate cyclase domain-containing protein [Mycobacterium sp.]|nr:adenylate/guanylate cyclase domain-containing protein [Mycobacterium sp.]